MSDSLLLSLYKSTQTAFLVKELSLRFPDIAYKNLKARLHYLADTGKVRHIRRGVYVKDEYNPLELANKLYSPSYISFETVLAKAGMVFQHYDTIFIASYLSRKVRIDDNEFYYRKLADTVLLNPAGIEQTGTYAIATPERAFLDAVFLYKDYHFGNISSLNWEQVFAYVSIYDSKVLKTRIGKYYKNHQHDCA